MLSQLFTFVISSISSIFSLMRSIELDSTSGITFFHVFLFLIFGKILIHVILFIKSITEVTDEKRGGTS